MNKDLKKLVKKWKDCSRCPLHENAIKHVFYRGDAPCDVLFIGEAPGKDENMVGEPFVGRAGDILNEMIKDASEELRFTISNPYGRRGSVDDLVVDRHEPFTYGITNIVCCLPLADDRSLRTPKKDEAEECRPRLFKTVLIANPKLVVLLGREAAKYFTMPLSLDHVPILELQHPAYIARNGGIGTITYDTNLVRLIRALENMYGQEEKDRKAAKRKKGSKAKDRWKKKSRQKA